jgi:glycosyltransferase involved in cell wall biosynthesis
MRIAWFTPLSQLSAIGRFSVAVTASLSKMMDVDLCYFDAGEVRDATVSAKRFQSAASVSLSTLSAYDIVIYNFGNYLPFHREIYLLSQRWPGVCILHDFVMHHFFAAYYFEYLRDPGAYRLMLERTYGSTAPVPDRVWETDDVVRFPLFEEITRGALGAITHSAFFKKRVETSFAGPVERIPLAYDAPNQHIEVSRGQLGIRDDQILVVTVGHMNPNKQVECVINALSRVGGPVSRSLVYAVLGPISPDYERKLKSAVKERGLGNTVLLLGQVSDEVLRAYLSAADICINLRFPAMEGASASAIEEMLFGKPVIVTDTGFFSELPDDCVIKVKPCSESDVTDALRKLANDPSARMSIGARAKAFAETEFHPDRYAKQVVDFIWEVQSAKLILGLADRVGIELWRMGVQADMRIVDGVAGEIAQAFGAKRSDSGG